jgi:hypothetical protein
MPPHSALLFSDFVVEKNIKEKRETWVSRSFKSTRKEKDCFRLPPGPPWPFVFPSANF